MLAAAGSECKSDNNPRQAIERNPQKGNRRCYWIHPDYDVAEGRKFPGGEKCRA